MSSEAAPAPSIQRIRELPIETARAVAIILLVSYHVIGGGPKAGLRIPYPDGLRLFADFLVDLRMPLFAVIAGAVFAMKPLPPRGLGQFFLGKARRLVLPGMVAIIAFEWAAQLGHTSMDVHGKYLLPFITGYAHFWFLQSILLIFVLYAPLDSLTHGRAAPFALAAAFALSLSHAGLAHNPFSADGAMMLLPYFILGILIWRHRDWIILHRIPILAAALAMLVVGSFWNIEILRQTGVLSDDRRDLQSLLSATGGCVLTLLLLPRLRFLDHIGGVAFTIYLYHVFGTSLMRRFLESQGVSEIGAQNLVIHVALGCAAGLILPIIIHKISERFYFSRLFILGLRPLQAQRDSVPRQIGGQM